MLENPILEKIIVGAYGCNCYIIGSKNTGEVFIVDPGGEPDLIISKIKELDARPNAIILTHAHPDHTGALKVIKRLYKIPLWYNKNEYRNPILKKADKWLIEGDILELDTIRLKILVTGGYSPGGLSFFTRDIQIFRGIQYEGIIFTGDALFRRSKGLTVSERNENLLRYNIRNKIIYNTDLSENFLILAGHMGITTIGEEKLLNPFGKYFLTKEDWKHNKYYEKNLTKILSIPPEDRP